MTNPSEIPFLSTDDLHADQMIATIAEGGSYVAVRGMFCAGRPLMRAINPMRK